MTTLTVEQQKQRYSRDLAMHTLKQWNAVRQAVEKGEHTVVPSDLNKDEEDSAELKTPKCASRNKDGQKSIS